MIWVPHLKPASQAEYRLLEAILEGEYPPGSSLPAERELATLLGITRPTLRESLQRLARDGWLEIQQGKPTRVRNYLQEGNLAVLGALVTHREHLPPDFIHNLLVVRQLLAPSYIRLAVENANPEVVNLLENYADLEDTPSGFAAADWELHHRMCILSGNPVFTLILNGFSSLYRAMAELYFSLSTARSSSREFYTGLLEAARRKDGEAAYAITESVMRASIGLWQAASLSQEG